MGKDTSYLESLLRDDHWVGSAALEVIEYVKKILRAPRDWLLNFLTFKLMRGLREPQLSPFQKVLDKCEELSDEIPFLVLSALQSLHAVNRSVNGSKTPSQLLQLAEQKTNRNANKNEISYYLRLANSNNRLGLPELSQWVSSNEGLFLPAGIQIANQAADATNELVASARKKVEEARDAAIEAVRQAREAAGWAADSVTRAMESTRKRFDEILDELREFIVPEDPAKSIILAPVIVPATVSAGALAMNTVMGVTGAIASFFVSTSLLGSFAAASSIVIPAVTEVAAASVFKFFEVGGALAARSKCAAIAKANIGSLPWLSSIANTLGGSWAWLFGYVPAAAFASLVVTSLVKLAEEDESRPKAIAQHLYLFIKGINLPPSYCAIRHDTEDELLAIIRDEIDRFSAVSGIPRSRIDVAAGGGKREVVAFYDAATFSFTTDRKEAAAKFAPYLPRFSV